MKVLTVKKLIEFRKRTDTGKKNFVHNLKLDNKNEDDSDGGGNYWAVCLSAIGNSYKWNDTQCISDKIDEFEDKFMMTDSERTETMYKRNLDILRRFEGRDFDELRPSENFKTLPKPKWQQIIPVNGLSVKVTPRHVFTFGDKDAKEIGAIWFVAQLGGYKPDELSMYADALFRYLTFNYSKSHSINQQYCIAMDVSTDLSIKYSELQDGKMPKSLNSALKEILKLMQ